MKIGTGFDSVMLLIPRACLMYGRDITSTLIDLGCRPSKCDRMFFGNSNVLNNRYAKWDNVIIAGMLICMAGVQNVTEVLQIGTVDLENGIAVTLAVLLIYTVDTLCHPISTKV
jgi:hypothetical protein